MQASQETHSLSPESGKLRGTTARKKISRTRTHEGGGIPDYVITAMLGHKNETTTEKYMRISYAQFNASTRVHRGLEAKSADISITDNKTFEAYLKSLDRDGLKNAMDAVYAQLAAST